MKKRANPVIKSNAFIFYNTFYGVVNGVFSPYKLYTKITPNTYGGVVNATAFNAIFFYGVL